MSIQGWVREVGFDAVLALVDAPVVVVLRAPALAALFVVHVDAVVVFAVAPLTFVVGPEVLVIVGVLLLRPVSLLLLLLHLHVVRVLVVVPVVSIVSVVSVA